jgi:hypothetical protein
VQSHSTLMGQISRGRTTREDIAEQILQDLAKDTAET